MSFEIKNFKGIKHIKIDLNKPPYGKIFTLVGLNESGKTTILEAISHLFSRNQQSYKDLCDTSSYLPSEDPFDLIPITERGFFTGNIVIAATIALENSDIVDIENFVNEKLNLKLKIINNAFSVEKHYKFQTSVRVPTPTYWSIDFRIKEKGKHSFKKLNSDEDPRWKTIVEYIRDKIPSILFYPTFLFEIPQKIYLENNNSKTTSSENVDSKKNNYYRDIIQDILNNVAKEATIDDHIVKRLKSKHANDRRAVDALLLKMSTNITQIVFGLWDTIFDNPKSKKDTISDKKEIEIKYNTDSNGKYYVEFIIKEDNSYYNITERSLGFRWFFCFILFTQLRSSRKTQTKAQALFLLDEPAYNLHSTAQTQLLESFLNITKNGSVIIYSTHSQYLINTKWLENAYVVENKGLKYEITDVNSYSAQKTKINITPYREFVNKHPEKTSYYQPILDVLQYTPCKLENIPDVIMCEGKTDNYIINYFQEVMLALENDEKISILPGLGCSKLAPLIALYQGWGKNFIILLDSDKAGLSAKQKYIEDYLLPESRVFTLCDINVDWKNLKIEGLITKKDRLNLGDGKPISKKCLDRIFQEKILLKERVGTLSDESQDNFKKLVKFLNTKIKERQ